MALYQRFHVDSARLQCQVMNVAVADGTDMAFVYPLRSDEMSGGIVPSFDRFLEGGRGSVVPITGSTIGNYQMICDTKDPVSFQGVPGTANYDDFSGSAGADPVIQPGWSVGFVGTNTHAFVVLVVIEYSTTLWAPLSQANA